MDAVVQKVVNGEQEGFQNFGIAAKEFDGLGFLSVGKCSQFINTLAFAKTSAMFIVAYSIPMHLWGPLPNTR